MTTTRPLTRVLLSQLTSDGAGVTLRRSIGSQRGLYLDPFLMLDEFGTDNPDDYIAGFPAHPHRGFETVTYMLDGRMQHRDHLGNVGDLGPGSVQWMTAGRGVIHSEMPLQEQGRMRGFQLWLNLPAAEKMRPAAWRDIAASDIPVVELGDGSRAKVIAGRLTHNGQTTAGAINADGQMATDPSYWDVHLAPGAVFEHALGGERSVVVYGYEGDALIGDDAIALPAHSAGVLGAGDSLRVSAGANGARFIVLAGIPLKEPVVQHGPFVMNTQAEIEQALADYRDGKLTEAA
jgi:redox-sensitive bicupin YhaK (pirin superfamily)